MQIYKIWIVLIYSYAGGISFFSPRIVFVCSNILEYEVVLANGSIVTASNNQHADLWRALKGGSNNFGVVTHLIARTFPSGRIWGGYLYFPPWKELQILQAFHDFVKSDNFDEYSSGPITTFVYTQKFRASVIVSNIMYTKAVNWPACWQGFKAIQRFWSSTKVRILTDATNELDRVTPRNMRCVLLQMT